MIEETLAARGIVVGHEAVRQWALKFGQDSRTRSGGACRGPATSGTSMRSSSKIAGTTLWPWRAVDRHGIVLDVLVQSRRDAKAAKRLLRKLLKR